MTTVNISKTVRCTSNNFSFSRKCRILYASRKACIEYGEGVDRMDQCEMCGRELAPEKSTTGYGLRDGKKYCFTCCAELDKRDLRETGVLQGYITYRQKPTSGSYGTEYLEDGAFTNWPGSFRLPVAYVKKSFSAAGGIRTDFWVMFEGRRYHGTNYGYSSQIATIRLVKGRR